jgi:type VII secretion integral membrane protein EccD
MDLALPDTMLVGELLPHLLRHAGEDLADEGELNGGWVLRRATGVVLDASRNLVVQGVRDGELLHLVHGRVDWPELAYDDVVEIIAAGARQTGRAWGKAATRRSGFAIAGALFGLGLIALLLAGPPWLLPAAVGFALAGCLTAVGILLSRAFADATAGAVAAAAGLPYAFLGGALLVAPADVPLTDLGAPNLLLGSASLLVFSVLGHAGVAALQRLFMAGIGASVAGILAALLCIGGASPAGSAGVTMTIALGMLPAYPLLASSMGRVPFPELPTRPEEILADRPLRRRTDVFASVARATELLTGMLLATAVISAAAMSVLLLADPSLAAIALTVAASAALLLRARLFPSLTQRVHLNASGAAGLGVLALGIAVQADSAGPRLLMLFSIVVAALLVLTAALVYGRRAPSPYLGRLADIADVVAIVALVPLSGAVLGLFRLIQGLFASIGG